MHRAHLLLQLVTERFPTPDRKRHSFTLDSEAGVLMLNIWEGAISWTYRLPQSDLERDPGELIEAILHAFQDKAAHSAVLVRTT